MEIRLCRDCRWMECGTSNPQCQHASSAIPATLDLVIGEMLPAFQLSCGTARAYSGAGRCGPVGKYWEAA